MKLCKSSRVWQHPDFDHDTVPWGVAWWDPWGAHWDAPYTMPCLSSHSLISEAWSRAALLCSKRWHWVWIGVRYFYHVGDEKSPWVWHRDPTWGYLSGNIPGALREVSSRGFSPSHVSRALHIREMRALLCSVIYIHTATLFILHRNTQLWLIDCSSNRKIQFFFLKRMNTNFSIKITLLPRVLVFL